MESPTNPPDPLRRIIGLLVILLIASIPVPFWLNAAFGISVATFAAFASTWLALFVLIVLMHLGTKDLK